MDVLQQLLPYLLITSSEQNQSTETYVPAKNVQHGGDVVPVINDYHRLRQQLSNVQLTTTAHQLPAEHVTIACH